MLLEYTTSIKTRCSAAFLRDPIPLPGMCSAEHRDVVMEELMISEPTARGLLSTPGACCTLTGEESMGTEMNQGCSCVREGPGSWRGSWRGNRDLPGTLCSLHKHRACAEQTPVSPGHPSTCLLRVSPSWGTPAPSKPAGPQICADAHHYLSPVACKAALLKYKDFLWL